MQTRQRNMEGKQINKMHFEFTDGTMKFLIVVIAAVLLAIILSVTGVPNVSFKKTGSTEVNLSP